MRPQFLDKQKGRLNDATHSNALFRLVSYVSEKHEVTGSCPVLGTTLGSSKRASFCFALAFEQGV